MRDDLPNEGTLQERFERIARLAHSPAANSALGRPLASWIERQDDALPFKFLRLPLREVLACSFTEIARSWTDSHRLECLVRIVERAYHEITTSGAEEATDLPAEAFAEGVMPERHLTHTTISWQECCEIINGHQLQDVMLGTIVGSLKDLPATYWKKPLGEFTGKALHQLRETKGIGSKKLDALADAICEIGHALSGLPADSHIGIRPLSRRVHRMESWLVHVLLTREVPTLDQIAVRFVRPLVEQLRVDLPGDVVAIVCRRLGLEGERETLQEIADDGGVTRERVRQLSVRATEVIGIRWPNGRHLLDDFYELLREETDAQEQVRFVRTILDRCFDLEFAKGGTRDELLESWEQAGRRKQTPMTKDEVTTWVATASPRIPCGVGVEWITEVALSARLGSGERVYFSNEPFDLLLLSIWEASGSTTLKEVAAANGEDERSLAGKLTRDPRFVVDDHGRILAAKNVSLLKTSNRWTLVSAHDGRRMNVPLDTLCHLVIAGFLERGIGDATVWGVHRYVNETLTRLYDDQLPAAVSPFVLQDLLVEHSEGRIRRMRRRRLRWDSERDGCAARGKLGWIAFVVRNVGHPVLLSELSSVMSNWYQDYEDYIFQQLSQVEDEEGDRLSEVSIVSGIGRRMSPMIVPDGWILDVERENVSNAIQRVAKKIVDIGRRKGFPRESLHEIPWMIELIDHYAYGKMNWSDQSQGIQELIERLMEDTVEPDQRPNDFGETLSDGPGNVSVSVESLVDELDQLL